MEWVESTLSVLGAEQVLTELKAALEAHGENGEALSFEAVVPLGTWDLARAEVMWGTPWDARDVLVTHRGGVLRYDFSTAEAAPLPAVKALSAHWDVAVHLGVLDLEGGVLLSEYYVDGRSILHRSAAVHEFLVCKHCTGPGSSDECEEGCWDLELAPPEWFEFERGLAEEFLG
jgi:hypothetical protein